MFKFYRIDTLIDGSGSFWISLLMTFTGTLLGFIGAFYLTKLTGRKQIKYEIKLKTDRYKERLLYLIQLVENSLKIEEDQLESFEELAKDISEDPTEQHFLKIIASNDLQRLQNMDTEEVFHAYHLITPENEDKIKDYKNIYGCIDFLYLRLKQAIESTDKHVNYTHRDQMYIKETIEQLSNCIYSSIKELDKNNLKNTPSYNFLVSNHKAYMKLIDDKSKIGNYECDFLIQFGRDLRSSFEKTDFFGELNDLSSKAIIRFTHIKDNSLIFSNELIDIRKEMKNSIDTLTKIKEKLKCNIKLYNEKYSKPK